MRRSGRGIGCLGALLITLVVGAVLVGGLGFLAIVGNNNSALWNRVGDAAPVRRLLEVDVVERLRGSDLADRVRDIDLIHQVRNTDIIDQINIDPEILQQVRDHGTIPTLPTGGATCPEPLILSAEWGNHDGGRSVAVEPSDCVRTNGLALRDDVWATLVANVPDADVPGMRDQLVCHMIGAQDKPTWNLEPWRPEVGLQQTILSLCNPS